MFCEKEYQLNSALNCWFVARFEAPVARRLSNNFPNVYVFPTTTKTKAR